MVDSLFLTFLVSGVWIFCVCVQHDMVTATTGDDWELHDDHSDHNQEGQDDEDSEGE